MDKRIKYRIVLDTETAPVSPDSNIVEPSNMLCYDYGWAVVDKKGTVYKTQSFICAEIFFGEKEKMKSSYYAEKIPRYLEDIKNGKRKVASHYQIRQALLNDIEEFSIDHIYAHNMRFDYGATKATFQYITNGKYKYFFPKNVVLCDTLKMARDTICKQKAYKEWCLRNGYLQKNGQPRATAEILYRYITKDNSFIESHTGLEDVLIEKEIMATCYRQKKKMRVNLWNN